MISAEPYPRDLLGYGGRPPHPRWPNDAKIAVSIVLNYEEGGEYSVLHGDPYSEYVLTDLGAVPPLQGLRDLNVESMFEYGSRVGFWEIMRLFRERGVDATIYGVGRSRRKSSARISPAISRS
jgi:peptidoglycan/xylan/chitin deacetylase (PgdA/CDA1 family)